MKQLQVLNQNKMNDAYNFRDLLTEYQLISIPKIQRDYAQGRLTGKAPDVRENFLNDIFSGNVKSLDFIFGTAQELPSGNQKKFIPLDGQQRLTTLFLLYLYGIKTYKYNIDNQNLNLGKFTYETRKAARDFCNAIVNNDWPEISQDTVPRDVIVKQKWFMNYWLNDPTVEGMLTMLDAIHEKAKKEGNYPQLDDISFRFFDMNEHNLSDNLYIKMNSRGKPLTAFENLKASIDKILPKIDKLESFKGLNDANLKKKNTFDEQWKYCIDRQWTDMFWKYKENYLSDPSFLRFIVNMLSAYWISLNIIKPDDDGEKDKLLRFFLGITGNEDYISFDKFKEVLPSKTENEENESDNKKRLETLVFMADNLNSFHKILELDNLFEICRPSWEKDEYDLIKNVLQLKGDKYNPSNKERAMFYALVKCPYISIIEADKEKAIEKIKRWMRVFWNVVEQEQERIRNFIGAVHLINELSSKIANDRCIDIYDWLAKDENEIKFGFMKEQVKEERYKAKQILNGAPRTDGKTWEDAIKEAEKTAFFNGAIRFLFTDENGEVNDESWGNFDIKWENAQNFFEKDGNGVTTQYITGNVLLRTLISYFEKKEHFLAPYYDNTHWRSVLLDKELYSPVCSLLTKECVSDFNEYTPICKDSQLALVQNQLVKTNLLDYLPKDGYYMEDDLKLHVYYGHRETTDIYLGDSDHENPFLAALVEKGSISCDQRLQNTSFFFGRNINFKYNKYFFRWYGFPNEKKLDVYLMEDNWTGCKKRQNPTNEKGTDEDVYFCFRVDENTTSDIFTKMLDCLIHQAEANKQNKPCYVDCKNKVCE